MSASFKTFETRARSGGLIPAWRDVLLDTDTPVAAFHRLRRGPFAFLLESAPAGGETWARYTFMGSEPCTAWRLLDGTVEDWSAAAGWHGARTPAEPMRDLQAILSSMRPAEAPDVGAFWAGAVGYFAYDVVRHFERLPHAPPRGVRAPDAIVMFPRTVVIIDNLRAQARVVCGVSVPEGADDAQIRDAWNGGQASIEQTITRLRTGPSLAPLDLDPSAAPATGTSSMTRDAFMAGVARIREHILAGDVFQALLARRIVVPHDFEGTDLYRAIRALNPSPYMYHLALDGLELVGSSPELLVRVADDRVVVRPIAGTRPRAGEPAEDDRRAAELLADDKERAEHVMLVDLGRNDVGRVAQYGSVHVTDFMTVERYSHVLHIVSQVEGTLAAGTSALDVFRATFPAGTMTGAPKVRAMEIIDALEPERRGPYAGAVGYVAAGDRRMDLAITIRTCVIAGGEASVQAGGGIVADSDPLAEWEETENKARAMLTAIGRVRGARKLGRPARRRPSNASYSGTMTYRLAGIENDYSFELAAGGTLACGRADTSDLAIIDPTVSRHHANVIVGEGGVNVLDVRSSNGTFVNGIRIEQSFVVPGDTLTFGNVQFRLEAIAERAAAPRTPAASAVSGGTIVRRVLYTPAAVLEASGNLQAVMAGTDPAEKDRKKLAILLEVTKGLTRAADIDALLTKVADYVFQILEADRCAILLREGEQMMQKVARDTRSATVAYQVPQSIVGTVVDEKVAVLSDDAGEDTRFGGQSILMQQVRSAICAPLIGSEDMVLGVLYVDNFDLTRRFGEADLDFLIAFAGIVAVALENARFAERSRRETLTRSNFERFFTPQLAARIAGSEEAIRLGGEKRPVAVLFSDIRGFTALSETMHADAMALHLTEYFTEMVDCVFRHGGTLDKFIGDAVMAQWGAPLREADDADRAMSAAMEMMQRLDTLNARWRATGRPELEIGIGINFGEAFAGNIGSERRLEYTVIGDTVNVASRLCSRAGGGEIIISEEFRRALARPPALDALEPLELKHRSQPVPAFRVLR